MPDVSPCHEYWIDYEDGSARRPADSIPENCTALPAEHLRAHPRRASVVRRELSVRNLLWAADHPHELSPAAFPSVVYREEDDLHGNFFPPSYRRILARPQWSQRLDKSYTGSRRLPHSQSCTRHELDCATSSDALLMSVFCHAPTLRSPRLRALLQMDGPCTPDFGVRTEVPLQRNLLDRTEADMRIGDLLVEAKLTESGFGTARPALLARYPHFEHIFSLEELPRTGNLFRGYQLLRNILAAAHHGCRFALFCDQRRPDLVEDWFSVLRAVRSAGLRSRLLLVTWQEIAVCLPRPLQTFLSTKYGIMG